MNLEVLAQGLSGYLCVVLIITAHEFGHAWMASRCGDDTARLLGRVTLNPSAHIDPLGTVLLPLLAVLFAAFGNAGVAGFIIGWGKPVPVNMGNLRHRVRDDILVSMAGPAMNIVIAMAAMLVGRIALAAEMALIVETALLMTVTSMFLFFFNLIPIPPLDGSRVMRHVVGMGEEAYANLTRYGFFILIIAIQIPAVRHGLSVATGLSMAFLRWMFLY
jgi:Zn-dependent protease